MKSRFRSILYPSYHLVLFGWEFGANLHPYMGGGKFASTQKKTSTEFSYSIRLKGQALTAHITVLWSHRLLA